MRKTTLILLLIGFFACKETPKTEVKMEIETETVQEQMSRYYPEALNAVFNAHGGLDTWKEQKTLVYDISKADDSETHTIDLINRKDKITTPNVIIGFDGQKVWLLDGENKYKGDPIFYHNLMFYFYAMPFVLADEGINYGETENIEFEGISYPGIRISYDSGVGTSPKDEYYLHYNPETFQMEWLGYTVTYRSGEKSDNVKWIRYDDWKDVKGVKLPKSITWHAYEIQQIKEASKTVNFENIALSRERKQKDFYEKPENAKYVEKH